MTPLRVPRPFYFGRAPLAAVFLTSGSIDDTAVDEILGAAFGLTPREAALAREIAHGRTIEEAAQRFGREVSTERSRMKDVFAKLSVTRQAELVQVVTRVAAQVRRATES